MTDAHKQFLKDQAETVEGQKWIKFIEEYVNLLYNVKGIPLENVLARQQAAEHLEKIVAHSQDKKPNPRNNEYR